MARKMIKSRLIVEGELVENLAEVPEAPTRPLADTEPLKVIGQPIPRSDGYDKVSGTAVFTYDVIIPHLAQARTLRCPHPHARIRRIDTTRARALPGVLAVLTHENAPKISWYGDSLLFDPHLRYEGDEVACVAADTEAIALEALALVEVEYEELPFVIDPAKAMESGAPAIHQGGNVVGGKPSIYQRGDAQQGLAAAAAVVEQTYSTQVEVHNPTEVHCSVVNWDGDQLTVWDSTQAVFSVRDSVAHSLGIPESHLRVVKKYMGGGFGSKLAAGKYTVMAALLAREIGRPVRIILNRREMNLAVGNRPDSVQKLSAAAAKDGTLTALTLHSYGSAGAYPTGAGCSWPLRTIYKCPNVRTEEYSVLINAGPARPFRAPGHVQGTFALESLMDELAEKLGMDPLELRMKNLVDVDQVMNLPYTSKHLKEAYEAGARAIGWERRRKVPGSDPGPLKRGLGMATQIWWGGGGPPAYATLKLNRDGSLRILAGTQDIGTGTYTILAQVAAEILGIPMERIEVILGDTAVCPYGPLSGGSLTAPSMTPAVADAAMQLKSRLLSGAAAVLDAPEARLTYEEGKVTDSADPSKTISIAEIIGKTRQVMLVATGARAANPEGYATNSFGAHFAEVEVDTETGRIRVLKVVAAHDVGRIVNRKTADNQFHGGIVQGISYAILEQRTMDAATGKVLTTNMHDYKLPTIMDGVPEVETIFVGGPDKLLNNLGVKGLGEPATIPTSGAVANAVYNAIGVRIRSLPMTPDRVLDALVG